MTTESKLPGLEPKSEITFFLVSQVIIMQWYSRSTVWYLGIINLEESNIKGRRTWVKDYYNPDLGFKGGWVWRLGKIGRERILRILDAIASSLKTCIPAWPEPRLLDSHPLTVKHSTLLPSPLVLEGCSEFSLAYCLQPGGICSGACPGCFSFSPGIPWKNEKDGDGGGRKVSNSIKKKFLD